MIGKKDLRKMAREVGSELRYVTSMMRPFGGSRVMITRNNGRPVMYLVNYVAGKRIRTSVSRESASFRDISRNVVLEAKKDILKTNYDAIVNFGKSFKDCSDHEIMMRVRARYPNFDDELLTDILSELRAQREEASDWAKQPYKQFAYLEDKKIHTTSRGLKVRTKSELALCELFYKLGIEFRYEEEIVLDGKSFGPDFIIRRKSDGKIFYWEHCGMMDDPKYRKKNFEKLSVYERNGIVPWDNLIITYDNDGSIDLNLAEAFARAVLCI